MSLNRNVARSVRDWISAWPEEPDQGMIFRVLRYLAQWRSIMLANTQVKHHGPTVFGGIFQGMEYVSASTEGALMPRLLGTYEAELHPHLLALANDPPECIVDVGCAEGYYAVGLARLIPTARIYAYDTDPRAQRACAELGLRNSVADRLTVGSEFHLDMFEDFAGRSAAIFMDAEGAELDLLQPEHASALRGMRLIVETHDVHRPGAIQTLIDRFAATHEIQRVDSGPKIFAAPPWMDGLSELDRSLAVWEWRLQPTPWLVMRPRT